jgi:ubiquitin C-terminal hydrolase
MNSLLQQFFNIDFIREGLLASPDNSLILIDESYLYQIKNIFAFLKATDKKYYNPKDFTNIFKNYDNQIMNVTEQMDVDEFYNLIIDRLEPYLKNTKYENLFKYVFSGIISNEIIGKNGCPHFSETKEFFQSIILQVKNKKNIEESLDAFIQGEMMEGDNSYNCERCEKKVSALKRQSFKKLPRVLVLVLKRFEYDYDTMQKNKINDYCEFPLELNMEKYTQEYLMKKNNEKLNDERENNNPIRDALNTEYQYDLTGVIIHTGTTERGHYYSFSKKNNSQWLEFNDTNVSPFNLEDLEDEAFGGNQLYFNNKTGKNELVEKSTNAYVLFYTRKDIVKLQEEISNSMDIEYSNNLANLSKVDKDTENFIGILKDASMYSNIQPNIIESIQSDNFQYWVSKMIFSNEYIDFTKDILLNYNSQLSELYNLNVLSRNEFNNIDHEELIKLYENKLKEHVEKDKTQISNLNKFQNNFNNQEIAFQKSNLINNNSNKSYDILNSNTKNSILAINCGSSSKIDKYVYENVRVKRFRKIFNFPDSSNPGIKINNLDFYYKKLADHFAFNSNIKKDFLISNIKRNKKLFSLSFKNIQTLSPSRTNPSNDAENNFNLIPDESEIQLPLENTYESSNLKNKSITKMNSYVNDFINTYKKDQLKFDIFKFASTFFFTTVLRCKDKNLIAPFVEFIKTHINLNTNNAVWLIEEFSNFELIQEFLIDCPPPELKRISSGIIYTALLKISRSKVIKESKNNSVNDFIIVDKSDLIENSDENPNLNDSENPMYVVNNFISCLINLISKKGKFPFKDFNTIYFILWRFSTIGFEQKEFLYNYGLIKFIVAHLKLRNKYDCDVNLEECFTFNLRIPRNNDMVNKKPPKPEKLSVLDELMERKQMEKINVLSDNYLLITLFEILSSSNYSTIFNKSSKLAENKEIKMEIENEGINLNQQEKIINLSEDMIKLISLEEKEHLRMYAFEASKTRQGSVYFNNLLNKLSFNNEEFSNKLFNSFYELFANLDFDELTCLNRPFRSFISLNDDLADIRVINY